MRASSWVGSWAIVGACQGAAAPPSAPVQAVDAVHARAAEVGARVSREIDCDADELRWACAAGRLPGQPAVLPEKRVALFGMQLVVRPGVPVARSGYESANTARLVLEPPTGADQPPRMRFDMLGETVASERLRIIVASGVGAVLRGDADAVPVPDAATALLDVPAMAAVTRTAEGLAGVGDEPVGLYRVGVRDGTLDAWVTVQPMGEGAFVGIFPDVPVLVAAPEALPLPPKE